MKDIQAKVGAELSLPKGYHVEYGGAYADQQQSFHELLMILITSSLLVFGVILFLFKDFLVALTILLIAVVLGMILTEGPAITIPLNTSAAPSTFPTISAVWLERF